MRFLFLILLFFCLGMTEYKVPTSFTKDNQKDWDSIIYSINHSQDTDYVLLWEGIGGRLEMAFDVFKRLRNSHKHITIKIVGPSISSHALVACYLPGMVEFRTGSLTLHSAFDGRRADKSKIYSDSSTVEVLEQCRDIGYITLEEEQDIIKNRHRIEIYPNGKHIVREDYP